MMAPADVGLDVACWHCRCGCFFHIGAANRPLDIHGPEKTSRFGAISMLIKIYRAPLFVGNPRNRTSLRTTYISYINTQEQTEARR